MQGARLRYGTDERALQHRWALCSGRPQASPARKLWNHRSCEQGSKDTICLVAALALLVRPEFLVDPVVSQIVDEVAKLSRKEHGRRGKTLRANLRSWSCC